MAVVKLFPVSKTFKALINQALRYRLRNKDHPPVCGVAEAANEAGERVLAVVEVSTKVIHMSVVPLDPKPPEVIEITIPPVKE